MIVNSKFCFASDKVSNTGPRVKRVKRVATRPILGGMIAVSRFSYLLLVFSAIESAYKDTKMHAVSQKLKRGPAVTFDVLENGP